MAGILCIKSTEFISVLGDVSPNKLSFMLYKFIRILQMSRRTFKKIIGIEIEIWKARIHAFGE